MAALAGPRIGLQGRLQVAGTNHYGPAFFKFALVPEDGGPPVWRSSPDADGDGQPDSAVRLVLERGVFALSLGDTNLSGMSSLAGADLGASDLAVRMWFRTGTNAFARLLPDQPLSTVGHALRASGIDDGAVHLTSLAPDLLGRITGFEQFQSRLDEVVAESARLRSGLLALSNSAAPLAGLVAASTDPTDAALRSRGFERFESFPAPAWQALPATADVPAARSGHVMAWGGGELLVWGGLLGNGSVSASGAAYHPLSGVWRTFSTLAAPSARAGAASAVSDTSLLVWGGFANGAFLGSGAAMDFGAFQWTPIASTGAPAARDGHVATWTGSRFLVWGGRGDDGLLADGGSYDPASRTWTVLPTTGAPAARVDAQAVWTGTGWILWGGSDHSGELATGATLRTDAAGVPTSWTPLSRTNAPSARSGACAVWTGSRLLVWGGMADDVLGDGAAYDPATDTWTPLPSAGAPSARTDAAAVWTGSELVVVSGLGASGPLADGAAYDPSTGRWRPLTNGGSPSARSGPGAAWTGDSLILFGGLGSSGPVAAPQQVEPRPAWHLFRKP